jgi:MinD-like ATPase involved in chromosome partitioning or flagellar assembly
MYQTETVRCMAGDAGVTTAALVGATGGAGTTRLTVELGATLAAAGRSVAVLDAAYATQGLAAYLQGDLDPDVTALVTDEAERPLDAGLVEISLDAPGRLACCPASAPFERLARAKAADAARRFEERIEEAAASHDAVLVDVPPVGANQAVAAVTACDRRAVVAPGTDRGADAVQRTAARLDDLGTSLDVTVATRGTLPAADVSVPAAETTASLSPTALSDGLFGRGVARVGEALFGDALTDHVAPSGVFEAVGDYVSEARR